ncbi:unnamed protein product [Mytilus coruscus]|uniref:Integrase catalytic domain-containing protein n=1 Tax=Mytilus coruscus TaxID=42192 RepID=A0A6J8AQB0_MYTCO|nr:unnamed protein product [Mytilus coruscus]
MPDGIYEKGFIEGVDVTFTADTGPCKTVLSEKIFNKIPLLQRPKLRKTSPLTGASGESKSEIIRKVTAADHFIISGYCEAVIDFYIERNENDELLASKEFMIEPCEEFIANNKIAMAACVVDIKDNVTVKARVLNPSSEEVFIKQDTIIGKASSFLKILSSLKDMENADETENVSAIRRLRFSSPEISKHDMIKNVKEDNLRVPSHLTDKEGVMPNPDNVEKLKKMPVPKNVTERSNYESQIFNELCVTLEIKKTRTTVRNPKCNGLSEGFNKTLWRKIRAYLKGEQTDWDINLGCLATAYSATPHESTGLAPNLLMLGKEVRLPAELMFGSVFNEQNRIETYGEYVEILKERMLQAHSVVRKYLQAADKRQKENYDAKLSFQIYQPGQPVWLLNEARQEGRCPKLQHLYQGPFLILKRCSSEYDLNSHTCGYTKHVREVQTLQKNGQTYNERNYLKKASVPYIFEDGRDIVKQSYAESQKHWASRAGIRIKSFP